MAESDESGESFLDEPVFSPNKTRSEVDTQPLEFGDEEELANDREDSPFVAQMPPTPPLQPSVVDVGSSAAPTTPSKIAQFACKLGMTSGQVSSGTAYHEAANELEHRSFTASKRSAKITISPTKNIKRKRLGAGEPMKTFVFMDFETTGVMGGNQDNQRRLLEAKLCEPEDYSNTLSRLILETQRSEYPRITEMSFISVPREVFVRAQAKMQELCDLVDNGCIHVRVATNVHTCQLNPELDDNKWRAYENSRIEGSCINLSREDLVLKNTFSQEWPAVRSFLDSCPKPACIVAHNGLFFDYRVLYGELARCGFIEKDMGIPEGVLFIDSYLTIRELEDTHRNELHHAVKLVDWKLLCDQVCQNVRNCSSAAKDIPTTVQESGNNSASLVREETDGTTIHWTKHSKEPDTPNRPTLIRASHSEPTKVSCRRRLFTELTVSDHPLLFLNAEEWSPAKRRRILPNFFKRINGGRWDFNRSIAQMNTKNKLSTIYETVLKSGYDAHYAQDDANALLQVCLAYGKEFMDYVDNKAADFPF